MALGIRRPSSTLMFGFALMSYMLVTAGVIYDLINEPPAIGSQPDENGRQRPVTVMPYRINGQYIIEGLSAGIMYVIGGVGFIILHQAANKSYSDKLRTILLSVGAGCVVFAYNICLMFLRLKMPGYLKD
eukprot:TRINITY_DN547_c0_g1_i1.p1 TRINITY_DN547_c0_g1~~TRINITY_DN547_c0_g1_i1.p1  ORF type:complete len:130 (-),score=19.07 TRINITY_DN547_c0_g1_i1:24-413(-)